MAEQHNKAQGHLSQEQVASDCLGQLRIKAAKQIKTRLIQQAIELGGFKNLPDSEQQLFNWAGGILKLELLNQKILKAGGKLEELDEQDQAQYRQLTQPKA